MAGPSDDAFARARSKFTKSIGPHLAQQFSGCTLKDVRDAIRDIQREHGEEDNLRNMRRLSAFIEAMEQFGKVVDVFLNASEFVCFVWGPIKFLLGVTFPSASPSPSRSANTMLVTDRQDPYRLL